MPVDLDEVKKSIMDYYESSSLLQLSFISYYTTDELIEAKDGLYDRWNWDSGDEADKLAYQRIEEILTKWGSIVILPRY